VREAHLYIGILGHRYGWVPDGDQDADAKSITELEYDACESQGPGQDRIPRLIFVRTTSADKYRDSEKNIATAERIRLFRARAAGGQRPAEFENAQDFETKLLKAFFEYLRELPRKQSRRATFDLAERGAATLRPVALLHVPSTDDAIVKSMTKTRADLFVSVPVSPIDPDTAALVQKALEQAQVGCLVVSEASLARMTEPATASRFDFVLKTLAQRGNVGAVVRAGVPAASLPESWRAAPSIEIDSSALAKGDVAAVEAVDAMFGQLCAALVREPTPLPRVALPFVVIAPTRKNVDALMAPKRKAFTGFEELADLRGGQFDKLVKAARARHKQWPAGFYGPSRTDWRCFGADGRTVTQLVEAAVAAINDAPDGSRERRDMPLTKIVLRHYSLDEYLEDTHGSRAAVTGVTRAALVCLDETALFDRQLFMAAKALLAASRAAIVSISPCDPAHLSTSALLSESSFLLGTLVTRFQAHHDPQCELSLNSEDRVLRWLRTAIPRLLSDGQTSVPDLMRQMEARLAASGT
jgi:hypothetical protein